LEGRPFKVKTLSKSEKIKRVIHRAGYFFLQRKYPIKKMKKERKRREIFLKNEGEYFSVKREEAREASSFFPADIKVVL
jgi:endonuclease I